MGKDIIRLLQEVLDEITGHAREAYPHECCGVLAGRLTPAKTVTRAFSAENLNKERANDRYEIAPSELLAIEKTAGKAGLSVVGFYHSHPDHPARPSQFDRDQGWPEYSYVIVAVSKGKDVVVSSWTFEQDGEPFREETLVVE